MIDNAYPLVIKHGNGKTAYIWRFLVRWEHLAKSSNWIWGCVPAREVWLLEGHPGFYDDFTAKKNHDISGFSVFQEDWPW